MYLNLTKNLEKIQKELKSINNISKSLIKYGSAFSVLLLALGSILLIVSGTIMNHDYTLELAAKSMIRNSTTVFAEVVIGGLLIDYVFNKK